MVLFGKYFVQMEWSWHIVWIAEAAFECRDSAVEMESTAAAADDKLFGLTKRDGFCLLSDQWRLTVYGHPHGAIRFMDGDDIIFMIQL